MTTTELLGLVLRYGNHREQHNVVGTTDTIRAIIAALSEVDALQAELDHLCAVVHQHEVSCEST